MDIITEIHGKLANTMILFCGAVGVWGLFNFARGQGLSGSFMGALAIGWGLAVLQSSLGLVVLLGSSGRPTTTVHYLYGLTAILIIPFIWNYVKDRHPRQALFFLSLTVLFVMGLGIRGMSTGG